MRVWVLDEQDTAAWKQGGGVWETEDRETLLLTTSARSCGCGLWVDQPGPARGLN